jgi:hypothetical protein
MTGQSTSLIARKTRSERLKSSASPGINPIQSIWADIATRWRNYGLNAAFGVAGSGLVPCAADARCVAHSFGA